MKRIVPATLCLLFTLAIVLPAFGQGGENAEWQAIQDERDARRQAEKLDAFIKAHTSSPNRPQADKMLVSFWVANKDYAKIVQHSDGFKQSLPSADAASKATIYTQGMLAAISLNNAVKVREFGEFVLAAEPNNFMALSLLANSGVIEPAKALDYAKKASALPKPATMADAQYQSLMTRNKNLVAAAGGGAPAGNSSAVQALITQKKYQEAIDLLGQTLQANPKDHAAHYQVAIANYFLMADAAQGVQAANDEQIKAMIATPVVKADVDKAAAKQEQLTKVTMDRRDAALEAFAKALAIGGPYTPDAKKMLDALYTNKKGSLEGEDQLIAEKKKELGVTETAPTAPPKK